MIAGAVGLDNQDSTVARCREWTENLDGRRKDPYLLPTGKATGHDGVIAVAAAAAVAVGKPSSALLSESEAEPVEGWVVAAEGAERR